MLPLRLLTLLCWCVLAHAEDTVYTELIPDDRALLDAAIAAGLPDPGGCTFWVGDVQGEPKPARPGFPGRWGWERLHLRFPDGHWLLHGLAYHAPAEPGVVLVDGAAPIGAGLAEPDADGIAGVALSAYATLAGAALTQRAAMDLTYDSGYRVGWTAVPPLRVCGRRLPSEQRFPTSFTPSRHDRLRRELHVLALAMAIRAPRDQRSGLIAAAEAMLTDEERPVRLAAIRRLLDLDEDSGPLVASLRAWSPADGWYPRFGEYADSPEVQDTPAPWRDGDADALVALLGSTDPTPHVSMPDFMPRTVGDAALQALAWLWGVDPRLLADRDPHAPWTGAEREATTQAIQGWWKAHRAERFPAAIIGDPVHADLLWRAQVAIAARKEDRPALAHAVVDAWSKLGPAAREGIAEEDFACTLQSLWGEEELVHAVSAWPCAGAHRCNLALAHELGGEPSPLSDLLRDTLAKRPSTDIAAWRLADWFDAYPIAERCDRELATALVATIRAPTRRRCALIIDALRSPVGSWAWNVAHQLAIFGLAAQSWRRNDLIGAYGQPGRADLALLATYLSLADERPLPVAAQTHNPRVISDDLPGDPTLRVCDEVAMALSFLRPHDREHPPVPPGFRFPADAQARDAALMTLREWLLPRASAARAVLGAKVELPGLIGPPPPAFPAWWQRELDAARAEHRLVGLLLTDSKLPMRHRDFERDILPSREWTAWAATRLRLVTVDASAPADGDAAGAGLVRQLYRGDGMPGLRIVDDDGREITSAANQPLIDRAGTAPALIEAIERIVRVDAGER